MQKNHMKTPGMRKGFTTERRHKIRLMRFCRTSPSRLQTPQVPGNSPTGAIIIFFGKKPV